MLVRGRSPSIRSAMSSIDQSVLLNPAAIGGLEPIFVGGLWDDLPIPRMGVTRDYAKTFQAETGRRTRYFPNARVKDVVAAIRDGNATGGPVNVVGHSYGGLDAYNASMLARRQGMRVDKPCDARSRDCVLCRPEEGGTRRFLDECEGCQREKEQSFEAVRLLIHRQVGGVAARLGFRT